MFFRQLLMVLIGFVIPMTVHPQSNDALWRQLVQTVNFAELARASFKPGCHPNNPLSATYSYNKLCPKIDMIPDSVIEETALPYFKYYVPPHLAREAIAFWSSDRGVALSEKMLKDIEAGTFVHLDKEDEKLLIEVNQTEYARVLGYVADDRELSIAVAQAMLNYEP